MIKINLTKLVTASLLVGLTTSCMTKTENKDKALKIADMDTTANPTENFYQYANGGWMKNNPLPEEESRFGSFDQLAKETNKKSKDLIMALAKESHKEGSIEQKIGDFFATGMDTAKIEEQGIKPLQPEFDRIQKIGSKEDVQNQIAYFHRMGISSLFGFYGSPDAKNSDMVITHLSQGGLGLTNRDYYVDDDERSKEIREAYVSYITKMFVLMGDDEAKAKEASRSIMAFETSLAKASMTLLERRDPHKTYNKMELAKVKELCPSFNWDNYFKSVGLENPGEINVSQPNFYKEINSLLASTPVETFKTYFRWNLINETASYLSSDFDKASFDFYGKEMQGKPKQRERWERVMSSTNGALGEIVGKKFTEKYFPPKAKEDMVKLVENLRISFAQRLDQADWMGEETKAKAKDKLKSINVKIGYPDKWKDFSSMKVSKESYVANIFASSRFHFDEMVSEINKPFDKSKWFMSPHVVNAYYAPSLNEICFPAGILQPPFFYLGADDAVNYGAIGVVIGHEMTHGFDDKGRLYDKEGNLNEWWTEEDSKRFSERSKVLVEQFNDIIVLGDVHANGELSLGENIADLGGLNISYAAFKKAQQEKPQTEKINGFTPDQRFFLAYSKVWAQNIRDKEILRRTKEDVHSLGINRVNCQLKNLPEFHAAFGAKEGDMMYLKEEERALIW